MTSSPHPDKRPHRAADGGRPGAPSAAEEAALATGRLSSFVGREVELTEITQLLAATRLLTLTGPGGIGKTRLAREVGAAYPLDEVFFVELDRIDDPGLVPAALLSALGAGEEPTEPPRRTVARVLGEAPALIVLDNCEHLQEACAELAQGLLLDCPAVRLLATSRESPLGVAGEVVFSVPGMGLPAEGEEARRLDDFDGMRLFVQRARQVRPGFALREPDAAIVASICRTLEGIPLAIELAAARLRILTPSQIADGLGDRLQLLVGRSPSGLSRHRTMRTSIEWSHELLDEGERTLLRRLTVFAGGFDLDAARAVGAGAGIDRDEVLDLIGALADKSLLATQRRGGTIRYRLLESVRQFAGELLAESERETVRRRHTAYFKALAAEADVLRLDPDGRDRLALEEPNFRAALHHAAGTDPESGLVIAAGLSRWWVERDNYREGRARCATALAVGDPESWPALRAIVLCGAGQLALYQTDFEVVAESITAALAAGEAADDPRALGRAHAFASVAFACLAPTDGVRHGRRAVELLRELDEPVELAWALAPLATSHAATDDYTAAGAAATECAELAAAHGDEVIEAWAEWILGLVSTFSGLPRDGLEHLRRALALIGRGTPVLHGLALARRLETDAVLGDAAAVLATGSAELERAKASSTLSAAALHPALCQVQMAMGDLNQAALLGEPGTRSGILYFEGDAHDALAKVALAREDGARAQAHAAELRRLAEAAGNPRFGAQADYALGRSALLEEDPREARRCLQAALGTQVELGARLLATDTVEGLGACAAQGGDHTGATRLLAASEAERERLGAERVPAESAWLEGLRGAAIDALGEEAYLAARQDGITIPFDDAIAYVRRSRGGRERPLQGWDALTPTEAQVAALAAEGYSNPQIAKRLFISRGTVKVHLSRAFAKLGVANRTALAAVAAREIA